MRVCLFECVFFCGLLCLFVRACVVWACLFECASVVMFVCCLYWLLLMLLLCVSCSGVWFGVFACCVLMLLLALLCYAVWFGVFVCCCRVCCLCVVVVVPCARRWSVCCVDV